MGKEPFLSIITVVRNDARGLQTTIDSIKAQDLSPVQYIVIDGNSSDATLDVIHQESSVITSWISEPDKGLYDAMNKGLGIASGLYVWFLNAGDTIADPYFVQKMHHHNEDIIYGETELIDSNGTILGTRSALTTRKLPNLLKRDDFLGGMVVNHQSMIVRREIAPPFDTRFSISADYDWAIKCVERARSIVNIHITIARFDTGGLSAKRKRKSWRERWKIMHRHFGFVSTFLAHWKIILRYLQRKID